SFRVLPVCLRLLRSNSFRRDRRQGGLRLSHARSGCRCGQGAVSVARIRQQNRSAALLQKALIPHGGVCQTPTLSTIQATLPIHQRDEHGSLSNLLAVETHSLSIAL